MFRIFEAVFASLILVFAVPVLIPILILVAFYTRRFPFVVQTRYISLDKTPVRIIKIRTLRTDKEQNPKHINLLDKSELSYLVPALCRWLRLTGLDEIFQLLNVIKGEMRLIGPRPLLKEELEEIRNTFPGLYEKRTHLNTKPGITGYWQLYGDRAQGIRNLVEMDTFYAQNHSFTLNKKIFLKTILVALTATHSDSIIRQRNTERTRKVSPIYRLQIKTDYYSGD